MAKSDTDRDLGYLLHCEQAVIGAVLLRPDALAEVDLEASEFAHPGHQLVWAAIRRLTARGTHVDALTLEGELGADIERCGGLPYLAELATGTPTADGIASYARVVAEAALTRRVIDALARASQSGKIGDDLLQYASGLLGAAGGTATSGGKAAGDWAREALLSLGRRQEAQARGEGGLTGVPTGFAELDAILGGLQRGVVTILAGRPSHGKSALARCIADYVSGPCGLGVHYFSHEDSGEALTLRSLSSLSGVELHRIRSLDLGRLDTQALTGAAENLASRRTWWIDDTAGMSSAQIASAVRRRARDLGTQLVVVDYVQLMSERGGKDRRDSLERAIEGLVALARRDHLAVLALSQLSRENERDKRPPALHDLRESGALEQAADAVLFVHRVEDRQDVRQVLVRKNKHGPLAELWVDWDPPRATFRDRRAA